MDLEEYLLHCPTKKEWQRVGIKPHHGFGIPLSSLHTKKSCGIGEFLDLIPLIDWCAEIGMDVIQLLPLDDSGHDPSPYNGISSCALNPMYLSLHALPSVDEKLQGDEKKMRRLTRYERVAYAEVRSEKLCWLNAYYEKVGKRLCKSKKFQEFFQKEEWVKSYALFNVFKEEFEHHSWQVWPKEFKHLSKAAFQEMLKKYEERVHFYALLQYFCLEQMRVVKSHAESAGVFLKGDIPILISEDSADVWHHQELFDFNWVAGAPPDFYNKEGQYWGFPLYDWERHKKTHYHWWKQRLECASDLYDIFRIDHVVGYFRIWGIPPDGKSKEGHFVPLDKTLWIPEGTERIEMMMKASDALPIAEDLGTVPDEVRACLKNFGICGTKVLRWERHWQGDKSYIPFQEYPPISITCVSTHDSPTLTQWWKEYPEESGTFCVFKHWEYESELKLEQRKEILWDSHHTSSLFHVNLLPEYLALFPDLISADPAQERINVPGKMLPTNWTYRLRLGLEDLCSHEPLKELMRSIHV